MNSKPSLPSLKKEIPLIEEVEKKIEGQGRLLLRYSGTEPLLRLLIEGRDEAFITQAAEKIVEKLALVINES